MVTKEERIAHDLIKYLRAQGLSFGSIQRVIRLAQNKLDNLRKVNR